MSPPGIEPFQKAALFLDRDGTLIEHHPYLHEPDKVQLLPGVREALHQAIEMGFQLFLHTNQSGVTRGYFDLEAVEACNRRMLDLLQLPVSFTAVQIATEAPGDQCGYRKPSPRFILESLERYELERSRCFMIGDHRSDVEAARNAGISGLALRFGAGAKELPDWEHYLQSEAIPSFDSLLAAVSYVCDKLQRSPMTVSDSVPCSV